MTKLINTLPYNQLMQKLLVENIPKEMKALPNWTCYFSFPDKKKEGKYAKTLINPNSNLEKLEWASSTDNSTWTTFDKAVEFALKKNCHGVAFVLQKELDICCIDLDNCYDDNSKLKDYAKDILKKFKETYVERSVSGKGIHIFCKGKLDENYIQRNEIVEMYNDTRIISMTAYKLPYATNNLKYVNNLKQINEELVGKREVNVRSAYVPTNLMSDNDVIKKLQKDPKTQDLWNGDTSRFNGDHSVAEYHLCRGMAFYNVTDLNRMDSLMRQSGLYRPKWDRGVYATTTMRKAIDSQKNHYDPQRYYGKTENVQSKRKQISFEEIER